MAAHFRWGGIVTHLAMHCRSILYIIIVTIIITNKKGKNYIVWIKIISTDSFIVKGGNVTLYHIGGPHLSGSSDLDGDYCEC